MRRKRLLVTTKAELSESLAKKSGTRGLVMTMGALHAGHLDLVHALRPKVNHLVATIFVNPTQFGPSEDYAAYPRDLDADVAKLRQAGVDTIFAPSTAQIYPEGQEMTSIDPGHIATVLEGRVRPGHFVGVCQIVAKMFHLVNPDLAAFGQKDAQQLAIVTKMVSDLDFGVEIVPVAIRRENDGLAMSSRNSYLSAQHRAIAPTLYQALQAGEVAAEVGPRSSITATVRAVVQAQPLIYLDYVALVDPLTFEPPDLHYAGPAVLAVAAKIGDTRLIDNTIVELR